MIDTVNNSTRKAGIILLDMSRNVRSLTVDAAKRLIPTGCVINPTDSAVTINTPKCTGSNPSSWPMGNEIGITTRIAAMGSRIYPVKLLMS
jgi:hypothetical protein